MNQELEMTESEETPLPSEETPSDTQEANDKLIDELMPEETPLPETSDPVAEPYEGDNNNATDETTGTE